MTLDWDQFSEGDEVAVTLIGTWENDRYYGPAVCLPRGGRLTEQGVLVGAVDAYRIEPDYKPGDMVRDRGGRVWVKLNGKAWWCITDHDGTPHSPARPVIEMTPTGATRVKVVDA